MAELVLKDCGDRVYGQLMRGMKLAWAFSEAAVRWGNKEARSWRNDRDCILFLGRIPDIVRVQRSSEKEPWKRTLNRGRHD